MSDDISGIFEREQLHYAAQQGDLASIKRLLSEGHPINAFDEIGKTPLHYAVEKENIELIKFFINAGANINIHDELTINDTPLGAVADHCSYEVAKLLIEAGADPTIPGWMNLSALDKVNNRKKPEGIKVKELLQQAAKSPAKFKKFKRR